jgi:hypothetical protein
LHDTASRSDSDLGNRDTAGTDRALASRRAAPAHPDRQPPRRSKLATERTHRRVEVQASTSAAPRLTACHATNCRIPHAIHQHQLLVLNESHNTQPAQSQPDIEASNRDRRAPT